MGGKKNSFWRKPLGTTGEKIESFGGKIMEGLGLKDTEIATPELSAEDQRRKSMFAGQLEGDITGENDSLAVAQYRKAQEDAVKAALSMAASTKGASNPALLARNVAAASDNQAQELAQDSAILRGQERQGALGMMNQYLATQEGAAQTNAQMQNEANQASANRFSNTMSSIGTGMAAMSDKNEKENIKPSKGKASEFLEALDSYTFNYKDSKNGQGEKVGIMAQDLEKSELGEQMVKDTPDGKIVDFGQGFAAILAAQAELKDEVEKMKKKGA